MALLTNNVPTYSGALLGAVAAAAGGDTFINNGKVLLYVKNASGASINVTVTPQAAPGGLTLANVVVAVATAAEKLLGPYDTSLFNNTNGQVAVAYSAVTSVTVAAIQTGN